LLLDTVACMIGGHATSVGRLAVRWAADADRGTTPGPGGTPAPAIVGGDEIAFAPALAAYANGRLAAVLDADETWPGARQTAHLAAATVAAALTMAVARDRPLDDLLGSIVAGYEVGARISDAMLPADGLSDGLRPGWGPGSPIAAAVGAARAAILDARGVAHAIGIAGSHVDPPALQWTEVRPAPMAKSADAGWHALTGVTAAEMAALGLTGYDAILDGDRGLWRALGYEGCDGEALLAGLGERWRILDAAFKRWPCQYWMHPALTALASVIDHDAPDPAAIDTIVIETNAKSASAKFHDAEPPGEIDRAFSFPHATAMLLLGVVPGPRWLSDATDADPRVRRLRGRVEVRLHPDARRITEWVVDHGYRDLPARVTVRAGERRLIGEARLGMGAPWSEETRLDDAALAAKARELVADVVASAPDGEARANTAFQWILDADPTRPARELVAMLAGLAGHSPIPVPQEEP
jgi:2-methylcitrate dehydratase PrpD